MIVFDGFFFFGFLWVFFMGFQSSKGFLESGFDVA